MADKREKARYELGNMDRYSLAVNGTVMENASFFSVGLTSKIDEERMRKAVCAALPYHPLFKTRVRYRKRYFLEENDAPVIIVRSSVADRPKTFGASTHGYPWRICVDGADLCFEWCHVVTDGRGALAFLGTILEEYFGVDHGAPPDQFALKTGFESFFDPRVKPIGQKKQPGGFKAGSLPGIRNGFRCTSHLFTVRTFDLLAVAKKRIPRPPRYSRPCSPKPYAVACRKTRKIETFPAALWWTAESP